MRAFTRLFHITSLTAAIAGCLITSATASDRPVIRGAYIEFPPLAYTTESGELEGTFIELVDTIADRAGYDIHWQGLPIERVYLYLKLEIWPQSL